MRGARLLPKKKLSFEEIIAQSGFFVNKAEGKGKKSASQIFDLRCSNSRAVFGFGTRIFSCARVFNENSVARQSLVYNAIRFYLLVSDDIAVRTANGETADCLEKIYFHLSNCFPLRLCAVILNFKVRATF